MKRQFYLNLLFLSCFLALAIGTTSCLKSNQVGWVYYDETKCNDPWEFTNNKEVLKDNVTKYCEDHSVKVYGIELFIINDGEMCSDCVCKTGRQFKLKIRGKDVDDAKKIGFFEK